MVEVVSIVLAVVSLVGSLVAAGFTGWISYYLDEIKARRESRALTNKYRDPLTLSAYELQSRFFGLVQTKLLDYLQDDRKKNLVQTYTSFLIGQYFSWVYIFKRQAQFVRFSTDKTNKQLNRIMDQVTKEFSDDKPGENAFMLWRGQQMAIGELMTLSEPGDNELYCMGFAAFSAKYNEDPVFKTWFKSIDDSIISLADGRTAGNDMVANKLRRLQHLLIDLVLLLDADIVASGGFKQPKVRAAPVCHCVGCPGAEEMSVVDKRKWYSGEKA